MPQTSVLARLPEGIALRQQGRLDEARTLMERLWTENGGAVGDALGRCVIAHSLADTQDDVHDELRWDLAALDAAHAVTDDEVAAAGMGTSAAALFPSLHLNLAECYRRCGDLDRARAHLDLGWHTAGALPGGDYSDRVRAGLAALGQRLGS